MLFHCWSVVCDDGPTLKQHWFNVTRVLLSSVTYVYTAPQSQMTVSAYLQSEQILPFGFGLTLKQHWAKRQYLLTRKVSRYCRLALHVCTVIMSRWEWSMIISPWGHGQLVHTVVPHESPPPRALPGSLNQPLHTETPGAWSDVPRGRSYITWPGRPAMKSRVQRDYDDVITMDMAAGRKLERARMRVSQTCTSQPISRQQTLL